MLHDDMTLAGVVASSLRAGTRAALIASGMPHDDAAVAYIAKRMVEREGASLRDEIEALRVAAIRAVSP